VSLPDAERFESVVSWMLGKGYIKKSINSSALVHQVKGYQY